MDDAKFVRETIAEIKEFDDWFKKNHPLDWWAKERKGKPLPTIDRLRVWFFARKAWFAARDENDGRKKAKPND